MKNTNETSGASTPRKALRTAQKTFWGAIYVIFGAVFLLTLWLLFDKYVLKAPVPSVFGYATLTIETGSMNGTSALVAGGEPAEVNIGDMILIKKTDDYEIGDVITFLHAGEKIPTTHRIIGYTEGGFITKGDANNTKDTAPVLPEEILGEVVGHYPELGRFASWVKAEGWIYIACIFGILAIGAFLVKLTDEGGDGNAKEASPNEGGDGKISAERNSDSGEGADSENPSPHDEQKN